MRSLPALVMKDSKGLLGDFQTANYRRSCQETLQHASDVGEILDADQVAGLVEADQVTHPRKSRDVGNGVALAHDPVAPLQTAIEDLEQALAFVDVAITGTLVFVVLAGEFVEKTELAEHRPDTAHLKHQPLKGLVTRCRLLRQQLPALVGEVNQNRPGLEQR